MVSRHKELAAALQAFLFRVAGWSRSAEAILLGGHYQALSRQTLAARLGALTEESKQKRAEFGSRPWNVASSSRRTGVCAGQKRRELLENIEKIAALGKQSINGLQPAGELERDFRARSSHLRMPRNVSGCFSPSLRRSKLVLSPSGKKCAKALKRNVPKSVGAIFPSGGGRGAGAGDGSHLVAIEGPLGPRNVSSGARRSC